jgi:hypothetical protein
MVVLAFRILPCRVAVSRGAAFIPLGKNRGLLLPAVVGVALALLRRPAPRPTFQAVPEAPQNSFARFALH